MDGINFSKILKDFDEHSYENKRESFVRLLTWFLIKRYHKILTGDQKEYVKNIINKKLDNITAADLEEFALKPPVNILNQFINDLHEEQKGFEDSIDVTSMRRTVQRIFNIPDNLSSANTATINISREIIIQMTFVLIKNAKWNLLMEEDKIDNYGNHNLGKRICNKLLMCLGYYRLPASSVPEAFIAYGLRRDLSYFETIKCYHEYKNDHTETSNAKETDLNSSTTQLFENADKQISKETFFDSVSKIEESLIFSSIKITNLFQNTIQHIAEEHIKENCLMVEELNEERKEEVKKNVETFLQKEYYELYKSILRGNVPRKECREKAEEYERKIKEFEKNYTKKHPELQSFSDPSDRKRYLSWLIYKEEETNPQITFEVFKQVYPQGITFEHYWGWEPIRREFSLGKCLKENIRYKVKDDTNEYKEDTFNRKFTSALKGNDTLSREAFILWLLYTKPSLDSDNISSIINWRYAPLNPNDYFDLFVITISNFKLDNFKIYYYDFATKKNYEVINDINDISFDISEADKFRKNLIKLFSKHYSPIHKIPFLNNKNSALQTLKKTSK